MNATCLSFDEVMKIADEFGSKYPDLAEKSIILANGFSIDCCKEIFSYKSLFQSANFSNEIENVFSTFCTNDFEKIIKILKDASKVISIYGDENVSKTLNQDGNNIKTELINVISDKHPSHQHKIHDSKFCSAYKFLSNFSKIFTLNYDMLLYWTLMLYKRNEDLLKYLKIKTKNYKDNFGRYDDELLWYRHASQNVFYLHGALHLFDDKFNIIKAETTSYENLMDVIKNNLDKDYYPLIVAEGSSDEKLNKISHNKYLQYAYENLTYLKGNLFIHGHSLDENDMHIFSQINTNKNIKKIFISVFEPDKNLEEMQQKVSQVFKNEKQKIYYYDSQTARVWDYFSEEDIDIFSQEICDNDFLRLLDV